LKNELTRHSKFLSLVLRHKPKVLQLTLDGEGWVEIDELIKQSQNSQHPFTFDIIKKVVQSCDKQRFKLSEDEKRIRANQGHSIDIDLSLQPTTPPDVLYHGTAARFLSQILDQGLKKQTRQHVHLSTNKETATKVGSRYGKPVILAIDAKSMHQNNCTFLRSDNGVWLTDNVPAMYLKPIETIS
jgi:putative RNA 2'-phosphotransferase